MHRLKARQEWRNGDSVMLPIAMLVHSMFDDHHQMTNFDYITIIRGRETGMNNPLCQSLEFIAF